MTKIADASAACTMLRAIRAAALLHLHREASEEAKVSSPSPIPSPSPSSSPSPLALPLPLALPHPLALTQSRRATSSSHARRRGPRCTQPRSRRCRRGKRAWRRKCSSPRSSAPSRRTRCDLPRSPPTGRAPASILTPARRDAPAQVLGVDDLVATLGVDRRDAVEVVCAVRNVEIARRFLRVHCAPHGHRLLQARPSLPRMPPQPRCPPPYPVASAPPPMSRLCLDPNLA